jgi:hypothetical protein
MTENLKPVETQKLLKKMKAEAEKKKKTTRDKKEKVLLDQSVKLREFESKLFMKNIKN